MISGRLDTYNAISVTHDCSVDDVGTWSHNYPPVRLLGQEKAAAWFGEILSFGTHADAGKQASEAGRPFDASRPENFFFRQPVTVLCLRVIHLTRGRANHQVCPDDVGCSTANIWG